MIAKPAQAGLALLDLVALSRIVSRIHISDILRPHPVQLNNRFLSKPSKVLHALGHMHKTADLHSLPSFFIKCASHPDVKRSGYNCDVFIIGMNVRRHFVACLALRLVR